VCVGASDMTTASGDPSSSVVCVVCTERFPRGVLGGAGMPPLVTCSVRQWTVAWGNAPKLFFGQFLLFLVVL
jgi:hypothetical protein